MTWHLETRGSPIRLFFETWLPNVSASIVDTADSHPSGFSNGEHSRGMDEQPAGYPWGVVGAAFDYRLRYFFDVTPVESLVAAEGARRFGGDRPTRGFQQLGQALQALFDTYDPRGHLLPGPEERLLCSYCYILALYEQTARASFDDRSLMWRRRHDGLADLLQLCSETYVDDILNLSLRFLGSQPELLSRRRYVLNPTFAASKLFNQDADLIVGSRLIEVKTARTLSRFRAHARSHIWQLAAYVLADTYDFYALREAGFYLPRQGVQLYWKIEELLGLLAGGTPDLGKLRKEYSAACEVTNEWRIRKCDPAAPWAEDWEPPRPRQH